MIQTPTLQLVRPRSVAVAAPQLSPDQDAVVQLGPGSGPVLVWGAPGTGKSTVLVEAAVRRIEARRRRPGAECCCWPRPGWPRPGCGTGFSARLDRSLSTSPARTWASYAFDLLRRAKVEGRLPAPGTRAETAQRPRAGPDHQGTAGRPPAGPGHERRAGRRIWATALHTRGFRQEIRQLFDRVIEYGLSRRGACRAGPRERPAGLGGRCHALRSTGTWWTGASPSAFDPAGIITAGDPALQARPGFPGRRTGPPAAGPGGRHPGGQPGGPPTAGAARPRARTCWSRPARTRWCRASAGPGRTWPAGCASG